MNCVLPPSVVACDGAKVPESAVIVTLVPSCTFCPCASFTETDMKATEEEPVHCRLDGLALMLTVEGTPPVAAQPPVAGLKMPPPGQVPPVPVVQLNVPMRPARLKLAVPIVVQLNCAVSVPTDVQLTTVVPETLGTAVPLIWAPTKLPVPVTESC